MQKLLPCLDELLRVLIDRSPLGVIIKVPADIGLVRKIAAEARGLGVKANVTTDRAAGGSLAAVEVDRIRKSTKNLIEVRQRNLWIRRSVDEVELRRKSPAKGLIGRPVLNANIKIKTKNKTNINRIRLKNPNTNRRLRSYRPKTFWRRANTRNPIGTNRNAKKMLRPLWRFLPPKKKILRRLPKAKSRPPAATSKENLRKWRAKQVVARKVRKNDLARKMSRRRSCQTEFAFEFLIVVSLLISKSN